MYKESFTYTECFEYQDLLMKISDIIEESKIRHRGDRVLSGFFERGRINAFLEVVGIIYELRALNEKQIDPE